MLNAAPRPGPGGWARGPCAGGRCLRRASGLALLPPSRRCVLDLAALALDDERGAGPSDRPAREPSTGSFRAPRKPRRGEKYDPQAYQAQAKARAQAVGAQRKRRPRPAAGEGGEQGSGDEEDVGPRKSLFVQSVQRKRTAARPRRATRPPEAVTAAAAAAEAVAAAEAGFGAAALHAEEERQGGAGGPPPIVRDGEDGRAVERQARGQARGRRAGGQAPGSRGGSRGRGRQRLAGSPEHRSAQPLAAEREGGAAQQSLPQIELPIPITREAKGSTAGFFTRESFAEAGAAPRLVQALAAVGVQRPSHIQAAALRAILGGREHVALADHSGSGKTLAYLVPLVQQLLAAEQAGGRLAQPRCPAVVVVTPTNELAAQVLRVARAISQGGARFRSIGATGGHKKRTQREGLREVADVVVGTPGRLAELLGDGALSLERCQAVVMDEVDVLVGGSGMFEEQVAPFREAAAAGVRLVLVTASLPEPVWADLQQSFAGIRPVIGPGLHRPAPGSLEQLIDCSGGEEVSEESGFQRKAVALLEVLRRQGADRTVVFCNKLPTCRQVENLLRRNLDEEQCSVLAFHTAIEETRRARNLQAFLAEGGGGGAPRMVLVCTDRASRGVDTANVEHVVLFDFPRDPAEYVRRAGRTARGAGGRGIVSMLALGRQVGLARAILARNESGAPLHSIPAV